MKHTLEEICKEFDLNENDILNAYCYGSQVYGTANEDSDSDYILVHKAALIGPLKNAFKENAKSSKDGKIQIINFSRTGFKAELEAYNMSCLECINLPEEFVLKSKWLYKIERFEKKEFATNIIHKVSNSWHLALKAVEDGNHIHAAKGFYHALRILSYAIQIKEHGKITCFESAKILKEKVDKNILALYELKNCRDELFEKLRS